MLLKNIVLLKRLNNLCEKFRAKLFKTTKSQLRILVAVFKYSNLKLKLKLKSK